MKHYYLELRPVIKAFCVSDAVINAYMKDQEIPLLELAPKDYQRLGGAVPTESAPVVGFLMGRDNECYSVDWNYLRAVAKTGLNIRFLTYDHCEKQLEGCHGLILPGGAFDSAEAYYTDPKDDVEFPSLRSKAYVLCIRYALAHKMPILGICAGAQMIAGVLGMKLYRNSDYIETPIKHKTFKDDAHRLNVFVNTPLSRLLKNQNLKFVNSRHNVILVPTRVQRELWTEKHGDEPLPLDIYAEANDGVPEAWGSEKLHILCVQWHPEDMIATGNKLMQGIYQWLADEIANMQLKA